MSKFIQAKTSDLVEIRAKLLKKQNNKCAICERDFDEYDLVPCADHQHFGNGLIRGVLCLNCNRMEGIIWKRAQRAKADLPGGEKQWLDNLMAYLNSDPTNYIHPQAAPKEPKVKKSSYTKAIKLFKEYYPKKKPPAYPRSMKLTKPLRELFEEFEITDFYYK